MKFRDKNPLFSKNHRFSSIEALEKCRKKQKIFIFRLTIPMKSCYTSFIKDMYFTN